MHTRALSLDGLLVVTPKIFRDDRGFFVESYSAPRYQQAGIGCAFIQDNHSRSQKHTIRGLHFQTAPGQAKLVRVISGRIFDVAVDIRPRSPTLGRWQGIFLDAETHEQLYVPVGFAHGFCVVSDSAEVLYKVSSLYDHQTESGIAYDDPDIGIQWPTHTPIVSKRDSCAQSFAALKNAFQLSDRTPC